MASKVVPQGIQNEIKVDIEEVLTSNEFPEKYAYGVSAEGDLIVDQYNADGSIAMQYQVITVIIPRQMNYNTEIRNG